ncbi:MarR family winged helix-turn-helix transcriptional regulator [Halioxenophilus aromaticivorans]|uniref:MarR family transcriptional regulator n=1 Tax=Halioxenophilus aromaticivorans TaxID=1306992 RepID=A0AAV3U6N3_9ALTE
MPLSHLAIERIAAVFHGYKTHISQEFAAAGVQGPPIQLRVLRLIQQLSPCTGQMLATEMKRDKAQITRLLQEMKTNGLVQQVPNPADKRSQLLEITATGQQTMVTMIAADDRVLAKLSALLTDEESKSLMATLEKLDDALNRSSLV